MKQIVKTRKKLIEVALPLDAINAASVREKSIRHGHPSTLHLWWARRPLASARAVIFSQLVDDPSAVPEEFPTKESQDAERERLFEIIRQLVIWENTTNEMVLEQARNELRRSWRRACSDNKNHPQAKELFNPDKMPAFHDPFAGGGALPLEAQRLGLESYASDLNPVAVLINKAMIEIPPKFAGMAPVNPESRNNLGHSGSWKGTTGLAEDVRYYGKWMRGEAEKRIGHLYPKIEITPKMVQERPDLKQYEGQELTVIAWLWARTVKSPNPAFADVDVPLASTFMLSTKKGKEAYVEPVIEGNSYRFTVKVGKPRDVESAKNGTKLERANFKCIMSGVPISGDYIKAEGQAARIKTRLMAIVAEGNRGRVYITPIEEHTLIANSAVPYWQPEQELIGKSADQLPLYGMKRYGDIFTSRQLVALTTFSDLVDEARKKIQQNALAAGLLDDGKSLNEGGTGSTAYADAVSVYLAFAIDRMSNTLCKMARWTTERQQTVTAFARQALPMTWDFPDVNPFAGAAGDYVISTEGVIKGIPHVNNQSGFSKQFDATNQTISINKFISTDPPYYDNIGYADLSDFFYVWLRRSLQVVFPTLFSTMAVPKAEELVATPYRHSSKQDAETFFLEGMTQAMHRLVEQAHPAAPVTIYYAFKQAESKGHGGVVSTGWEAFLEAVITAGFTITGTWPMRTELSNRMLSSGTNALASSVVIVCSPQTQDALMATRREFLSSLQAELPVALAKMQRGNIAPVDLQQAVIGPGMAVYTRYSRVLDNEGNTLTVREALALINQTLDEILTEQEGDFDVDTRWALVWFEQNGFTEKEYGTAETLSRSKNTSVDGLAKAGIVESRHGRVRLLQPSELPDNWIPDTDKRINDWKIAHQLIRAFNIGEEYAAELLAHLGSRAEPARELAYRLYTICDRKKWLKEAQDYNMLVKCWSGISQKSAEFAKSRPQQGNLL